LAEGRSVFESFKSKSDKERFISAMFRKPVDRVPNFEVLIEDMYVEKILGKFAGSTLAIGGDPAKGAGQEGRLLSFNSSKLIVYEPSNCDLWENKYRKYLNIFNIK